MREILEEDNTIFDVLELDKFIDDKSALEFVADDFHFSDCFISSNGKGSKFPPESAKIFFYSS